MGRLTPPATQHRHRDTTRRVVQTGAHLSEFYPDPIPATALLLESYLRAGSIPLRDPGAPNRVVSVDLRQAAAAFGADLADTRRYLHRLHAAGELTIDRHGTVDVTAKVELL